MPHVELIPQRHAALSGGGYRVQSHEAKGAQAVVGGDSRATGRWSVIHRSRDHSPSTHRAPPRTSASPHRHWRGQAGYERVDALVWKDMMTRWHGKKWPSLCDALRASDTRGEKGCRAGVVRDGSFPNADVESHESGGDLKTFPEQMEDKRWRGAADLDGVAGESGR